MSTLRLSLVPAFWFQKTGVGKCPRESQRRGDAPLTEASSRRDDVERAHVAAAESQLGSKPVDDITIQTSQNWRASVKVIGFGQGV